MGKGAQIRVVFFYWGGIYVLCNSPHNIIYYWGEKNTKQKIWKGSLTYGTFFCSFYNGDSNNDIVSLILRL